MPRRKAVFEKRFIGRKELKMDEYQQLWYQCDILTSLVFVMAIFDATWSVVRWLTLYVPARYNMAEAYSAS